MPCKAAADTCRDDCRPIAVMTRHLYRGTAKAGRKERTCLEATWKSGGTACSKQGRAAASGSTLRTEGSERAPQCPRRNVPAPGKLPWAETGQACGRVGVEGKLTVENVRMQVVNQEEDDLQRAVLASKVRLPEGMQNVTGGAVS